MTCCLTHGTRSLFGLVFLPVDQALYGCKICVLGSKCFGSCVFRKLMQDALCLCSSLSFFLLLSTLTIIRSIARTVSGAHQRSQQASAGKLVHNEHSNGQQQVVSGRGGSHVTGGRDLHADGLKELCEVATDAHAGGWLVSVGGSFDPNKETKRLVHCDCLCICYTISNFCST